MNFALTFAADATTPLISLGDPAFRVSHFPPSFISLFRLQTLGGIPHPSIHHLAVRRLGKHNPSMFSINLMPHPNLPALLCLFAAESVPHMRMINATSSSRQLYCLPKELPGRSETKRNETRRRNRHFNYSSRRLRLQIPVFRLMRSVRFGIAATLHIPNQDCDASSFQAASDTFRLFLSQQPRIAGLEQQESVQKGKDTAAGAAGRAGAGGDAVQVHFRPFPVHSDVPMTKLMAVERRGNRG